MATQNVWIVEEGAYEQRGIEGVYASVDAGMAAIKKDYGPPYVVTWTDPGPDDERPCLVGEFQQVIGYSTKHTARFDFMEYEVRA